MASIAQRARSQRDGSNEVRSLLRDEAGIGTTEYVIILALIAIGAIAAWRGFGASVRAKVNTGSGEVASLEGVGGGGGGSGGAGAGSSLGGGGGGSAGSGATGSGGGGSSASAGSGAGGGGNTSANGGNGGGNTNANSGSGGGSGASGSGGNGAGGGAAGSGGGAGGGAAAAARSNSNVSSSGASDVERANEQLDQQAAEELRQRRLIAFGVALVCLLSLIGLAVYNTWRAKKIREEAARQKALAAKQAYAAQSMDGLSSMSFAPPPPTTGGGSSDSLADITIPPPPKS